MLSYHYSWLFDSAPCGRDISNLFILLLFTLTKHMHSSAFQKQNRKPFWFSSVSLVVNVTGITWHWYFMTTTLPRGSGSSAQNLVLTEKKPWRFPSPRVFYSYLSSLPLFPFLLLRFPVFFLLTTYTLFFHSFLSSSFLKICLLPVYQLSSGI